VDQGHNIYRKCKFMKINNKYNESNLDYYLRSSLFQAVRKLSFSSVRMYLMLSENNKTWVKFRVKTLFGSSGNSTFGKIRKCRESVICYGRNECFDNQRYIYIYI